MTVKLKLIAISIILAITAISCNTKKDYETVKNDPIKARIYTLDNGLKVYMAANKEQPRIQTFIAVRAGGKNDPAETTGLAHYFEHLMFKGTTNFGTSNYEAEKPLLDEIENLFEIYRKTTDDAERKALYKKIDSISYEASKIAIPNEYDKLMSTIGANGTNAYTSYDVTCYTEDIPSNQIENWAKIQADRFSNVVIRGFHTELETVYEEYNISLTSDSRKIFQNILAGLYPNHPYGTQTVLGTQEQLKNPSIINIKNFYKEWYVPNNMAICLSGDFDPDETINIIKKYFGELKPNENLPKLQFKAEEPITTPVVKEAIGLEAERIALAWRLNGANSDDADLANIASSILYNGQAGLIDINLLQQQKILNAYAYQSMLSDYGMLLMQATPKEGQTLDEAKDLLLAEIAKLRNGDFDETLLKASIDNYKLQIMQYLDSNYGRADIFVDAFINGVDWEKQINVVERLSKITKDDIVKFANEKFGDNNYVAVYKRQGQDPNEKKIEKPQITPIATNRDEASSFLQEIKTAQVNPIEPVFVDFNKDMEKTTAKSNIPVLYKKNETTDLFSMEYVFEVGSNSDATIGTAFSYLDYLGTSTKSPEEIKKEFYNIACSFSASVQTDRCYVSISGLSENMPKAVELMEELINDAQPNDEILENLKFDILKSRKDSKLNQRSNFSALQRYLFYGQDYIKNVILSNDALNALKSTDLLAKIKDLIKKEHYVLYYGPMKSQEVADVINKYHKTPETLVPITEKTELKNVETPENKVFMAEYDAKNTYYIQYSNRGDKFDVANDANVALYNEYFGGGMNSIVFQEMREARSLAYSASAYLNSPSRASKPYVFTAFIISQNDKVSAAVDAFAEIIENMPESEAAFNIAKQALISRLSTERTIKDDVLWEYIRAKDMGVDYDRNKAVYENVQNMTLADVKAFQEKWIKNRTYFYGILGNSKDLDLNKIRQLGEIKFLKQQEIFGY
ncbi:MAG: insulinase family protein [Prevotellaceae bacterium]|jgi:predicted Zn-dependent peptidase|nr:insulinase family protein [Prevotellaceae bacterium]